MRFSKSSVLHRFFFFQAEDGIRDVAVTGVQTCALPISSRTALYLCPNDLWAGSPKVKPLRGPHPEVGRLRRNPPKPSRENKPRGRRNSRRLRRGGWSKGDRTIQRNARGSPGTGASREKPGDARGA